MIINMIAARSENNIIGIGNDIPWHIPGEQKQFKELTTHNAVIMGRKTYESIGRPLANRINIVVSKTQDHSGRQDAGELTTLITARSLEEALEIVERMENVEVFIAGGGTLYAQALPIADRLYMTDVKIRVPEDGGAVFFPDFSNEDFIKYETASGTEYDRVTWIRRTSLDKFGPVISEWRPPKHEHDYEKRASGYIVDDGKVIGNICLTMNTCSRNYKTIWWKLKRHDNVPSIQGQSSFYLPEHSFEDVKEIAGMLFIDQLKKRRKEQLSYINAIDSIGASYGVDR